MLVLLAFFALALGTRLPGVDLVITADEGYWVQRTIRFSAALARGDLAGTYRSGHPGVTVMWVGLLGNGMERLSPYFSSELTAYSRLERAPGYLEVLTRAKTAAAIFSSALLTLAIALVWRLLGPGPAVVGGLVLLLDPYMVGMTRLLHVDSLLTPLMTVSLLAGLIYWLGKGRWPFLLLSATTCGLALLTKAPAAFLAPYLALVALLGIRPWRGSERSWRLVLGLACWGGAVTAVYFALWPSLWVEPTARLQRVVEFVLATGGDPHTHWGNYFLGTPLATDPGPLYYAVALAFRINPVTQFGLVVLALVPGRRGVGPVLLGLIAYGLLFMAFMSVGPKKLDRYLLPVIAVLNLLAGVGLWHLATQLRRWRLGPAVLLTALALEAAILWRAYPYPIAAYNPLLGGAQAAAQAIPVGWGEGLEQTADFLNGLPDAGMSSAATHYINVLRPRYGGHSPTDRATPGTDYFVLYINFQQRNHTTPALRTAMEAGPPVFTAVVHDTEFAWVYRLPDAEGLDAGERELPSEPIYDEGSPSATR